MNVQEAAKRLRKSEPTIRRWIRDGKLKATMVDKAYDISEQEINEQLMSSQVTDDDQQIQTAVMRAKMESLERQLKEKDDQIKQLQVQLAEKDKQIDRFQEQLAEASHRHDTLLMQMTRLLEWHQQPFWKRLLGKKALPAPVVDETIMDMEPGDDKDKE